MQLSTKHEPEINIDKVFVMIFTFYRGISLKRVLYIGMVVEWVYEISEFYIPYPFAPLSFVILNPLKQPCRSFHKYSLLSENNEKGVYRNLNLLFQNLSEFRNP